MTIVATRRVRRKYLFHASILLAFVSSIFWLDQSLVITSQATLDDMDGMYIGGVNNTTGVSFLKTEERSTKFMAPPQPTITSTSNTSSISSSPNTPRRPTHTKWFDHGQSTGQPMPTLNQTPRRSFPRFIMGLSTGHSGSTSLHQALVQPGCPWNKNSRMKSLFVQEFENVPRISRRLDYGDSSATMEKSCNYTRNRLIPKLVRDIRHQLQEQGIDKVISSKTDPLKYATYVDLGHYHNRGQVLECLVKILTKRGKKKKNKNNNNNNTMRPPFTLVRIRRNRHQTAYSFAKDFQTPCIHDLNTTSIPFDSSKRVHPVVTTCPRSGEFSGKVHLTVPGGDAVWDAFSPFQRFLWYVDEMEARWYALQQTYHNQTNPLLLEVTWSQKEEFSRGMQDLRTQLGCEPLEDIPYKKPHINRQSNTTGINCTELVLQDLEYRKVMGYNIETQKALFENDHWTLPHHMDSDVCIETRDELEAFVEPTKKHNTTASG